MGVKGLLQALRPVARESCLSDFAGRSAAIDGYAWLHKAAFTAVENVVNGTFTDKPTRYVLRKVAMVRSFGVRPVVVLDGRPLPSKAKTNFARHASREASRADARRLAAQGDSAGAYKAMGQAISITWQMVEHLLCQLQAKDVEFIVAPYEADAQLGYLSHTGYVDFVISEDSDLILYGCRKVFFKLDDAGRGLVISAQDLPSANLLPLTLYSHDSLIQLCSLAGCDYSDGIKGLGLKKGGKLLSNFLAKEHAFCEDAEDRTPSTPVTRIDKLAKEISAQGFLVPDQLAEELRNAYLTFKYQAVYDPVQRTCVRNHPLPPHIPEKDFMGVMLTAEETRLICSGKVEPKSMKPSALATAIKGPVAKGTTAKATADVRGAQLPSTITPIIAARSGQRSHSQVPKSDRTGSDATEMSTITSFFRVQSPTAKKKKKKKKQAVCVDSDVTPTRGRAEAESRRDVQSRPRGSPVVDLSSPVAVMEIATKSKDVVAAECRLEFGPRVSLQPLSSDPDEDDVPTRADPVPCTENHRPVCNPIGADELNKMFENAMKKPAATDTDHTAPAPVVPCAADAASAVEVLLGVAITSGVAAGGENEPPVAANAEPAKGVGRRASMVPRVSTETAPQSSAAAKAGYSWAGGKRRLDAADPRENRPPKHAPGSLDSLFAESMLTKRRRASEQFRNEKITF
ncbi:exonuclease [Gregarina niphandrodes]|uniref:Exonuclease 1 n=1 Tax=Gregarina niphandrodes TaxID=110365 RepID=A0A023B378_GRENI|nr:exonuclease [Gregarina niphandrodes]EZG55395.1 exonuclease [Gregarina niphandrodes]|eukprot:XP_011131595.1 exonuclease [Gregarina niphandrodes]